tara:strand:- start:1585 stop:2106 length:522 start_codon:yes stop_codon:yes gene_type:complete
LKIRIFLIFLFIIYNTSSFSANIRVLDLQKIIEDNKFTSILYEQINKDQMPHKEKFQNDEFELQTELEKIEELNLILDPAEFEKEIEIYNKKLNNFNIKIEKFNLHYELQINNLKNKILNIILEELKKYSSENEIDLVLDSTNYILSSNTINITKVIQDIINNKQIEISFEKY